MLFFRIKWPLIWLFVLAAAAPVQASPNLFGYAEARQDDLKAFGQWLDVLERHVLEDAPEGNCNDASFNRCHLRAWFAFLDSIRSLAPAEQLDRINRYANRKQYIIDLDNYGQSDYWAIAREFLYNGGDCEDYAITKLFSLRWLNFAANSIRIVVLQDTNLRVAHAILAVYRDGEIFILDNQTEQVLPHHQIVHYVPVYSIDEKFWWIHTPAS